MSRIEKALKKAIEQQDLSRDAAPGSAVRANESERTPFATEAAADASSITLMSHPQRPLTPEQRAALKIISPELDPSAAVKAFRELRTKVGQRVAAGAVIMVTGVEENSGSSFVSLNLAAAIAFDSTRTALLIDCNLRAPTLARLVATPAPDGLTDFLDGNRTTDVADIIHGTGIERLRVVPVGKKPDRQSEYFTLDKTRRLIADLAARYPDRQIVLDAPPIGSSADAQILAGVCDHILVVVPYARISESRLLTALKSIDSKKLLGVVVNDEPTLPPLLRRWFRKSAPAEKTRK